MKNAKTMFFIFVLICFQLSVFAEMPLESNRKEAQEIMEKFLVEEMAGAKVQTWTDSFRKLFINGDRGGYDGPVNILVGTKVISTSCTRDECRSKVEYDQAALAYDMGEFGRKVRPEKKKWIVEFRIKKLNGVWKIINPYISGWNISFDDYYSDIVDLIRVPVSEPDFKLIKEAKEQNLKVLDAIKKH